MKKRLDGLIVERGIVSGRDKAKAMIMAGQVYVDGQKADKPGCQTDENADITVREGPKYVSRGGLKLEKALEVFPVSPSGLVCLDIGASTGGFTDCMLQNGAARVYAVDVGYGQLAWSLRSDRRVSVLERTNIRYLTAEALGAEVDFATVDVSFISLKLVLPVARELLRDGGDMICLIKPQFEAGRERVGTKGVVRSEAVRLEVVRDIANFAVGCGFSVLGLDFSPVKGPEGNIEYLMLLKKSSQPQTLSEELIEQTVSASRESLEVK